MPIFGSSLNFAMRLNSGCKHFKRNFLVSDHVPVIWPKEVVVQKISDITIKGLADTREIFAIEV
jgi:class 3 adenylate cyclase